MADCNPAVNDPPPHCPVLTIPPPPPTDRAYPVTTTAGPDPLVLAILVVLSGNLVAASRHGRRHR